MDISRTISEPGGDFSQKFTKSYHSPCILRPAVGVPLGI